MADDAATCTSPSLSSSMSITSAIADQGFVFVFGAVQMRVRREQGIREEILVGSYVRSTPPRLGLLALRAEADIEQVIPTHSARRS